MSRVCHRRPSRARTRVKIDFLQLSKRRWDVMTWLKRAVNVLSLDGCSEEQSFVVPTYSGSAWYLFPLRFPYNECDFSLEFIYYLPYVPWVHSRGFLYSRHMLLRRRAGFLRGVQDRNALHCPSSLSCESSSAIAQSFIDLRRTSDGYSLLKSTPSPSFIPKFSPCSPIFARIELGVTWSALELSMVGA